MQNNNIIDKIDNILKGDYLSSSIYKMDSIIDIIKQTNKEEFFDFLILEKSTDNPDFSLKKSLILKNIVDIFNIKPELIINVFTDSKIIKICKNNDFYNTSFLLNVFNHIAPENHLEFLNANIENDLFSANNLNRDSQKSIIDNIHSEYFSLTQQNTKNDFKHYYYLNSLYINANHEISLKLQEKNIQLFVNTGGMDFHKEDSIDLFFMNKNWFKEKYSSRHIRESDGVDFLIKNINNCSTEKNVSYIHKIFNEKINEDNRELLSYLNDKGKSLFDKLISSPSSLPLNGVMKKLFTLNEFKNIEIDEPLLSKNPRIMTENNFSANLQFLIKHFGIIDLVGNSEKQQKIVDFFFNVQKLDYFFKDTNKANKMQKISIKLLDIMQKNNLEINKELFLFLTIFSKIENKNTLNSSHFSPEIFYEELKNNLNKPLFKKLFLYLSDEEKDNLNKIISVYQEKSIINKLVDDNQKEELIKNKKRI